MTEENSESSKEENIVRFITALKAVEEEMEPFKEHKRDLKRSYIENNWLSKEELSYAVKAYRMLKSDLDYEVFANIYNKLSKKLH
jgi:hypothetical protein